jgi:creatinine amidohydrolase
MPRPKPSKIFQQRIGALGTRDYPGRWLAEIAWPEVEALLSAGASAVLPVGAGAKEHGRHLPMSSDQLQAEWLCERLRRKHRVLIWPALNYGYYPAFVDYPASLSLTAGIFTSLAREVLNEMLRVRAGRVIIVNTGISTIAPLETAIRETAIPDSIRLANLYRGAKYLACEQALLRQPRGGHADEAETSIMLIVAPKLVRMELAEPELRPTGKGPLSRCNSESPNYSPSGVFGDPALASKAMGFKLLEAMLDDLDAALCDKA